MNHQPKYDAMREEWEHDSAAWHKLHDAPTPAGWALRLALAVGAVCIGLAIVAKIWGRA